jgi:hypothetical protein
VADSDHAQAGAPGASSADRIAHNEAVFRDINERIANGHWPGDQADPVAFRCECGRIGCNQLVELTMSAYERARADARRFILVAGHEIPDVEVVVERGDGYVVVEKVGVAGDVADATDPR